MADNLIFPIGFDLESAVKEAGKEWDSAYAAKLEKLLAKRPVKVELDFDTKKLNNLDDVKRRLAEVKIEPITPENKTAIRDLVRELKELARIMEKVQKFKGIELPELQAAKAAKLRKDVAQADEKLRLSQERVRQAQERLTLAQQRAEQQARRTSNAYASQGTYLQKLTQRMAAYWSVHQVGNFLTAVRDVTAEFELQRISLGAIIQDQARANQLFAEIKSFALKSPVKILDLTKYTKQLAAYKIGVDELFETTKKLTDVSVGLGVSMDRVVLAYGQTRATGYLRASEIRQFTEMGVPIVEELATKLSKMNGELVTAAQVMDMVSKRGISFELVKEVFDDMTSAGGIFYNMQEKQGNTLYGLWAKLGDAASVMYDQIGNTDSVRSAMEGVIQLLTDLMRNWETAAKGLLSAGVALAGIQLFKVSIKRGDAVLLNSVASATKNRARAQAELNTQLQIGSNADKAAAREALKKARADEKAAIAARQTASKTSKLGKGLKSLGTSLASGFLWGAAIAAITAIGTAILGVESKIDRMKRKLSETMGETTRMINNNTQNFIRLAERVAGAGVIEGSRDQKEALEELKRTFGSMIPEEELTIENLKRLRSGATEVSEAYKTLTDAIEGYIVQTQKQKAMGDIESIMGADLRKWKGNLTDNFEGMGSDLVTAERFFGEYDKILSEGTEKLAARYGYTAQYLAAKTDDAREALMKNIRNKALDEALAKAFGNDARMIKVMKDDILRDVGRGRTDSWINKYTRYMLKMIDSMRGAAEGFDNLSDSAKKLEEIKKRISDYNLNLNFSVVSPAGGDKEFAEEQTRRLLNIKNIANTIRTSEDFKKAFEEAGVEIDEGWFNISDKLENGMAQATIDFKAMFDALKDKSAPELRQMLTEIQKIYQDFAPSDETVKQLTSKMFQISKATDGLQMKNLKMYLWDGSGEIEKHLKDVKGHIEQHKKNLYALRHTAAVQLQTTGVIDAALSGDITKSQSLIDALEKYAKEVEKYVDPTFDKDKGPKSDPRLGILQEMVSTLKQVNKEYDDLAKKEGAAKALEDTASKYENTFKYLQSLATKYKFELPDFGVPTDAASLTRYLNAIKDAMKKLPESEKAVLSLETDISDINMADAQKKIEEELKRLADRISRTKTAKEFYDKILGMTGDMELAADVSMSVYGQDGQDLQNAILAQIQEAFETNPETHVTIDLSTAIDPDTGAINYNKLAELEEKYKGVLIADRADLRQKLIDEGRKTSAAQAQQWLKDIEKAKSFAQQRIELATYTANQIAAINAREDLPQAEKDKLIKGYRDREAKQTAKLQYDEFKDSAMYIHIFEDLDHASTTALKNMRDRLIALKGQWQNLDPTQVKELTKAIADLDAQIAGRSPFKSIIDGFKGLAAARPQEAIDADMIAATDELAKREEALAAATRKLSEAQTAQVNAQAEVAQARQDLEDALAVSGGKETPEVKAAREVLAIKIATFNAVKAASKGAISAAKTEVDEAANKYEEQKKVIDKLVAEGKLREANIKKIELANQKIDDYQSQINEGLGGIRKMMEAFGASEEDMQFFDDVVDSLNEIADAGQQASMSVASFMSGDILGGITSGISAIGGFVSGFTNLFSAGKVRKANKEIKRQQELLEQLQYTYSRLENASDKVFGRDYINNFRQQQKNLEAQARAYQKQAAAERSKGKKADKDKIKEYENAYRDTMDEIADMQGQIAAQMLGTDLTSAARDFAKAWLDAYKEFGNTADAMSEKFHEMIENMIVESLLAKVMERALKPAFDMIDNMGEEDFYSQSFWEQIMAKAEQGAKDADHGAQVMMEFLEKAGISMRDMNTEYTGIKRDIAGASEETMSSVAVIGNTLMYYVSPIPRMDENLAAIRRVVEAGVTPVQSTAIDTTALWNRHLELQQGIYEHTRRSADKCEAMAAQCAQIASDIHKVIVPRGGGSAAASIQVRM